MALKGPVIIVEDDHNDAEVIVSAIKEIGIPNEARVMNNAEEAYDYLHTTQEQPFLILCDIRLPQADGLAFRDRIMKNEHLRKKSIPFIFFTGMVSQDIINTAYDLEVQGFYQKAFSYQGIKDQLLAIFIYWKHCLHPNT